LASKSTGKKICIEPAEGEAGDEVAEAEDEDEYVDRPPDTCILIIIINLLQ
jgi:hypothetical protein